MYDSYGQTRDVFILFRPTKVHPKKRIDHSLKQITRLTVFYLLRSSSYLSLADYSRSQLESLFSP